MLSRGVENDDGDDNDIMIAVIFVVQYLSDEGEFTPRFTRSATCIDKTSKVI